MKNTAIKSLAAAALAFCALAGASPAALAQDAALKVDDAWVRSTVPSQHATGVFMRLTSVSGGRLVGVESQAAKHVEIHEMAMQDNVMKMRQVPGIALPGQISPGEHVALTLIVEDADKRQRRVPVDAVARPLNAAAAPAAGHGH
jgi:copper(I)-binding protein